MAKTIRELLDHAKTFHRQLAEYYQTNAAAMRQPRARLLLEYMADHERNLEQRLSEYGHEAGRKLLDHWLKFTPETPTCTCFERARITPDMSVDQVVDIALTLDNCLLTFYRQIAEEAVSDEVRDLFNTLVKMAEQDERMTTRNALEMKEL